MVVICILVYVYIFVYDIHNTLKKLINIQTKKTKMYEKKYKKLKISLQRGIAKKYEINKIN